MGRSTKKQLTGLVCTVLITSCLMGCKAKLPFQLPFELPDLSHITSSTTKQGSIADGLASLKRSGSDLAEPTIREAGVLTIGINTNLTSAPFVLSTLGGDAVKGYGIELGEALADELGLDVRFVNVSDIDSACANTVDIVLGVSKDDVKKCSIVGQTNEAAPSFFYRGDERVLDKKELSGKSCGLVAGKSSEATLSRTDLKMNQKSYSNLNEAFDALDAGEVEYVLCDAYAGAFLANQYKDIHFAGSLIAPVNRGIAVLSSNKGLITEIGRALETLKSNGVDTILRTRWLGKFAGLSAETQIGGIKITEKKDDAPEVATNAGTATAPANTGDSEGFANSGYGSYVDYSDYGNYNTYNDYNEGGNADAAETNTEAIGGEETTYSTNEGESGEETVTPQE